MTHYSAQRQLLARSRHTFLHTLFACRSAHSICLFLVARPLDARDGVEATRSRPFGCLRLCGGDSGRSLFPSFLPSLFAPLSFSSSFPAPSSRDPATKNLLQANSCLLLRNVISARRVTQKEIDYGGTLINCRVIQKLRILSFLLLQPGPCSVPLSIGLSLAVSPVPIAGDSRHLLSIYNLWPCRPAAGQCGNLLQRHPNEGRREIVL